MSDRLLDTTDAFLTPRAFRGLRFITVGMGAIAVALAAQVAFPIPYTPVPFSLAPVAVIAVGGILGWAGGAAALATYLGLGLLGAPVFAAGGSGIGRLMGPTGGYLLAYPVAAAVVGAICTRITRHDIPDIINTLLACALGMAIIHVGGWAMLSLQTGDAQGALQWSLVPFLTNDLLKVGLAAGIVLIVGPRLRAVL